jgi:hypothetical protein
VRYLSQLRKKTTRIAFHYLDVGQLQKHAESGRLSSFGFKMEKGLPEFILGRYASSSGYVRLLWRGGKREVFSWISSVVVGILELQRLGLFHSDLTFRNTIKTQANGEEQVFKVIDFDYAFKVATSEYEPQKEALLATTRAIILFWFELTA